MAQRKNKKGKRLKMLRVTNALFLEVFRGDHPAYSVVKDAVPDDAIIINVRLGWGDLIEVLIKSDTFPPVRDGKEPPILEPIAERK